MVYDSDEETLLGLLQNVLSGFSPYIPTDNSDSNTEDDEPIATDSNLSDNSDDEPIATDSNLSADNSDCDDDDEPIATNTTLSAEDFDFKIVGKTGATVFNRTEAPLEETRFKVLFKLLGAGSGKDRPGVDLVAVLDVSGSMGPDYNPAREDRIAKLKMAMQFVIKKLSPIDRLSVVEFNGEARRLCPLRQMTETCQTEMENIINDLVASGSTNILAGLEKGLQVLSCRRLTTGRVAAIMLMSDGEQKIDQLPDINVPVHTFGVGQQYDPRVLQAIAKKSKGGTFSDVQKDNLSIAFSQCLAGLLTVVVQDLTLTLTVQQDESKIVNVYAGDYPKSQGADSVTISFGDLYDKELRLVIVDLKLPAVTSPRGANVLFHTYSYKAGADIQFRSSSRNINISRVETKVGPEEKEILQEVYRLQTIDTMKKAKDMAEQSNFAGATSKLVAGKSFLKDKVDEPNAFIQALLSELGQLVKLMQNKDIYDKQGRAYALSSLTSHDRQRAAARGDEVRKGGLYTTPRMDAYLEQAKAFMEDPSEPLPTVDDDVEQEIRADPLGSIAGALSYYIQTAIDALKSIHNIVNKKGR